MTESEAQYILLVDDKPSQVIRLRELLKKELKAKSLNVGVRTVRTLNSVWDMIRQPKRPAVVVLDLFLPTEWNQVLPCKNFQPGRFNQGQLLGCHMQDAKIPFFYFTNDLSFLDEEAPGTAEVVEKSDPEKAATKIVNLLLNEGNDG